MPTPLTDADKVLRNDTGKDIVSKLDDIVNAIQASNIPDAEDVSYDNSDSGLNATNVQDAIDEVVADIEAIPKTASEMPYDNTTSELSATKVQGAIDEVEGRLDTAEGNITNLDNNKLDKTDPTSTGAFSHTGDVTVSGSVTTNSGFVGNLTGSVTGNVTGDLTGNVTGNVTGNLTGDVTGTASNATNADNATNAENANTVNNLTILTAVPANAVFTDTDELADLKDVEFTNLTDGQVIVWNATAGKFKNITLPDPMVFRGSLGVGGTIEALPVDGTATIGDTYKVITDGTYAGQTAKVGDTFICLTKTISANTWVYIPSGDEPSGTVTSIKIQVNSPIVIDDDSAITTSGVRTLSHANSGATAGSYGDSTAQTPDYGATFKVPFITVDDKGHITSISEHTVKIPESDNTTYSLTQDGTDGHKITLTPSSGTAQSITIPDNDTTYTLGADGNNVILTPSSGSVQRITVPYATKTDGLVESEVTIGNKIPYNFRPTNGGYVSPIGDRETDMLVGGTVAFNQLVQNGNFANVSKWTTYSGGSYTVSNNVASISGANNAQIFNDCSGVVGHKLLLITDVKTDGTNGININLDGGSLSNLGTTTTNNWTTVAKIFTATNTLVRLHFKVVTSEESATVNARNVNIFDITAMFGSTIADYIYGLETATAGAGVAYFRSLFPNSYYAYDNGSLISVKTSAHKTVGFNAFDETWEQGYIDNNGNVVFNIGYKTTSFIRVIPNTTYYCKATLLSSDYPNVAYYDANKNFISKQNSVANFYNHTFNVPNNAFYLRITITLSSTSVDNFCINLSCPDNGKYEPYSANEYALDADLELRGIAKLDANNKLYYDGDTYESDGTVTRKYGIVDLGSLEWTYTQTNHYFNTELSDIINGTNAGIHLICSDLEPVPYVDRASYTTPIIDLRNQTKILEVRNTPYTDVTSFTSAMSGVYIVYELATPTTETAEPFTNPQIVDDFGTEEYVDSRDVAIPVGHETSYYQYNDKEKLNSLPNSANEDGIYAINQIEGQMALNALLAGLGITLTQSSNGITISAIPAYKDITGTLTAGQTSITLQDDSIQTTSTFEIFVDDGTNTDPCIQPTSKTVATGSITLTFLAQASDINVKVRVS